MACAGDSNIQLKNEFGYYVLYATRVGNRCRKSRGFYPSFAPSIYNLSTTSSSVGAYSLVYISGSNFFPPCNGLTYVNFGSHTNLPIIFYSTSTISFVVPLNAIAGTYDVKVVNIYNGNFSLSVNQSYPGVPNYSNSIAYTLV